MSSHREAPEISKDPVADSTDLYAFVSPDAQDTVTFIANYVPLQGPAGGPNFYEFGDDVLYEINIDNDGDGDVDITYQFEFTTQIEVGGTFLYNIGPITALDSPTWNRRQFYSVTRIDWEQRDNKRNHGRGHGQGGPLTTVLATNLPCPPCNVGPRSTPDYATLANSAIQNLPGGGLVFAGQRAEGFYVDLGSIFDLGALRPIQNLHELSLPSAAAVNATKQLNVHTIALQLPKTLLTDDGSNPSDPTNPLSVIGVYTSASRQRVHFNQGSDNGNDPADFGPWTQVSRLGNPLFNEVLVPMERKDDWNQDSPFNDSNYANGVLHPELATLLPSLYPTHFMNLAALNVSNAPRADLAAILLTGIPLGVINPTYQTFTGSTQADLLRLNMAIPPATTPNNLGLLGNDIAGFPNGRRVADDVVTIELKAIVGATYSLIDTTFTPDGAVGAVDQGLTSSGTDQTARGTENYLGVFPYLGVPYSGFDVPANVSMSTTTHDDTDRHADAHAHGHAHSHDHEHAPVTEPRLAPSGEATVILDIGDNVGALVVHTSDALLGVEIEIARRGESRAFVHTEVRERRLPDGPVYAGVFPAVEVGEYTLLAVDGSAVADLTISSGRVTEVTFPT